MCPQLIEATLLKHSYTLLAPFYDPVVAPVTSALRRASLAELESLPPGDVLVDGIGTGLDVPFLPPQHRYVGLDLTRAMLARVPVGPTKMALVQGDAMQLPFHDGAFDHAVLHLIVAIVPSPVHALGEAARVVRPGGRLFVLDKFLRRGQTALARRALNGFTRFVVTRLDVVFEDVLDRVPLLRIVSDAPVLLGGWFRRIVLERI